MDNFSAQLNDLLVGAYHSIGKLEELSLKSVKSVDLSISELHLLEAIGKGNAEGYTIGQLAQDMGITLPSVTVAIKKLEKKGYAQKIRSDSDARRVHVILTRRGRKMEAMHRYFHRQLVCALLSSMEEGEKQQLFRAMQKLNAFIQHTIENLSASASRRSKE
ncbi:MarR family transcriptional regulator [Christensenellaceae bacterium NSJ-63]|uniref:MarR family transcriptional regulator n=1 Tax=Guopingia tenuis TaxID=2763656 RepID=A0A926DHP1_9FIRM|nr:MarR family transcriptional regulator [Guopingia tenuis]MBC8539003.1 MarR family transcriptional regulator [Guopingia tenuis]